MIKFLETAVVFTELPGEISLAINLTNCPNHCPGCSEPYLAEDIGEELTESALEKLLTETRGISAVCFMGGDNDHAALCNLCDFVHKHNLRVGVYSGRDFIDLQLVEHVDYYKVGRWIMPEGEPDTWARQTCGPISWPNTNQRLFYKAGEKLTDITWKLSAKASSLSVRDIILPATGKENEK